MFHLCSEVRNSRTLSGQFTGISLEITEFFWHAICTYPGQHWIPLGGYENSSAGAMYVRYR